VAYLGFMPTDVLMEKILMEEVRRAGVSDVPDLRFPIIARGGTSANGHRLRYLLNYSASPRQFTYPFSTGTDLLSGNHVAKQARFELHPWGVAVIEED
jgi:beta-galactosidase